MTKPWPSPRVAAITVVALALLAGRARAGDGGNRAPVTAVDISADVVSIDPGNGVAQARGGVRAEIDGAVLSAEAATFDPRAKRLVLRGPFELAMGGRTIRGEGLELDLSTGALELAAPRLAESGLYLSGASARCEEGLCVIEDAGATPCPDSPPACGLAARRVILHPSGDVDLEHPRLVLGNATVAALPWLRLRPPEASGFLPPRLGWSSSAGPVIGPAGQVALGRGVLAGGHFAARGISGYESSSRLDSEAGDLRVDHLFDDGSGHHGRLRLGLSAPLGEGARLSATGDLLTDRTILDETAFDPVERAPEHTTSLLLLAGGGPHLAVETRASLLQWLGDDGEPRGLLGPSAGVGVTLPPVAWELPVWPGLALDLDRVTVVDGALAPDALGAPAPAHTRLETRPSLDLSRRLALFELGARAATLHQVWLPDGAGRPSVARHAAGASARVELPFEGSPFGVRHRIAPGVGYRVVATLAGGPPPWLVDHRDLPAGGQAAELSLDNGFGDRGAPALSVALRQRFHLPGFGSDPGPAWADLRAEGGPEWLRVDLAAALDERSRRPSLARATLSSGDGRGTGLSTGASWYGPGEGPHLEPSLETADATDIAAWPLARALDSLELTERASAALGRHVLVHGGVRVGVIPGPVLHGVWYGLKLRSSCGCATVGLLASHRPRTAVPDVMLTLALFEM